MIVLLVVGIGVFVAGLVTAAFGLPVKEFSFGNTLILAGTVMSCTGLIMISLSLVVRELRAVADRLRSETMALDRSTDLRGSIPWDTGLDDSRRPRWDDDQAVPTPGIDPTVASPVPLPPRQAEMSIREDVTAPEPAASPDTSSQPKARRNLLFSSSMRKDRERSRTAPDPQMPRPPSFDGAWPRPVPGSASSAPSSPGTEADRLSGRHGRNAFAVTVLRSGVVDGLAYSLYSDGTIEAQLPEGMMRFTSIDQLRAHLDRDPDRPPSK